MILKVLLVDDEINIIKNLQQVIPWGDMDIEVIGLAKNGIEALDYITADYPDLLLTDIRMPVMDGITLLEHVRQINSQCEILILTGYQDFEYARSAIQYGVKEYILKPINYESLENTVKNLSFQIRKTKTEKKMEEIKWGKVVSLAYEKVLMDIMTNTSSGNSHQYAREQYELENLSYIMLLIDIDNYTQRSRNWNDSERRLWHFACKNVLQDVLQSYDLKCAVLQLHEGEWCLLIERAIEELMIDLDQVKQWASALQQAVNDYVKFDISVCIYPMLLETKDLFEAYQNVQKKAKLTSEKLQITIWSESYMDKKSTEMMMLSAKEYIERNIDLDLGIDELADFVGISGSYFSMLFKQHFSETFLEYLTRKRMEKAMSMLEKSDHSVAKIGQSVGYLERRYFTRVFQKYNGITPSEYRENHGKG